jgi:hypothetical protein
MITCPVCRFDAEATTERCPDCGTALDNTNVAAQSPAFDNDNSETSTAKSQRPRVGDVVLDRYTLQTELSASDDCIDFIAETKKDRRFHVSIVLHGPGTRPLVLAKSRDPILRLKHPFIERYQEVKTDDRNRAIIVTQLSDEITVADLLKTNEINDKEPLNRHNLGQFMISCSRLLELLHRRHALPGLDSGQWCIQEDGSPLMKGLMVACLRGLSFDDDEEEARKDEEVKGLLQTFKTLIHRVSEDTRGASNHLQRIGKVLSEVDMEAPLTASILLSTIAKARSGAASRAKAKESKAKESKAKAVPQQSLREQHAKETQSDIPTISMGAPHILSPRKVHEGPQFVPKTLAKQRQQTAAEEARKIAQWQGTPNGSQLIQLEHDLLLINGAGWLLPFFAASQPAPLVLAGIFAVVGIPGFSSLTAKKASSSTAFLCFTMLGFALGVLTGSGSNGILWGLCLAVTSAYRASLTRRLAVQGPEQDEIYGDSLMDIKRKELEQYIDVSRAIIAGGAALGLSILPAASGTDYVTASGVQSLMFGGFATYMGLRRLKRKGGRPMKVMALALIFAGVFCCWSFIHFPLSLISGLTMTLIIALGFGWLVEQGGLGDQVLPEGSQTASSSSEIIVEPLSVKANERTPVTQQAQSFVDQAESNRDKASPPQQVRG